MGWGSIGKIVGIMNLEKHYQILIHDAILSRHDMTMTQVCFFASTRKEYLECY